MFGKTRGYLGTGDNAQKLIPLIGFILITISFFALISFTISLVGIALLVLLGLYAFFFLKQRVSSGRRMFIVLTVGIALVVALLGFLGFGLVGPVLSLGNAVSDLLSATLIKPLIIFFSGMFLIFYGKVFYKLMGILLIFVGFTGAAGDLVELFSKVGAYTPNYFLFAIALLTGLILLFKVRGTFPKVLGVFLPILTFPSIANLVNVGIGTLFGFYDVIPGYLTFGALLIGILAILSAIYMMKNTNYTSGRTTGIFLAILLIFFSFSNVAIIFIDPLQKYLIDLIFGTIAEYEPSLNSILVFVIGMICLLARPVAWGIGQGQQFGVIPTKNEVREMVRERMRRNAPPSGYDDPNRIGI